jgi:hypothetical protein
MEMCIARIRHQGRAPPPPITAQMHRDAID